VERHLDVVLQFFSYTPIQYIILQIFSSYLNANQKLFDYFARQSPISGSKGCKGLIDDNLFYFWQSHSTHFAYMMFNYGRSTTTFDYVTNPLSLRTYSGQFPQIPLTITSSFPRVLQEVPRNRHEKPKTIPGKFCFILGNVRGGRIIWASVLLNTREHWKQVFHYNQNTMNPTFIYSSIHYNIHVPQMLHECVSPTIIHIYIERRSSVVGLPDQAGIKGAHVWE
jgi:hypothetical protein